MSLSKSLKHGISPAGGGGGCIRVSHMVLCHTVYLYIPRITDGLEGHWAIRRTDQLSMLGTNWRRGIVVEEGKANGKLEARWMRGKEKRGGEGIPDLKEAEKGRTCP